MKTFFKISIIFLAFLAFTTSTLRQAQGADGTLTEPVEVACCNDQILQATRNPQPATSLDARISVMEAEVSRFREIIALKNVQVYDLVNELNECSQTLAFYQNDKLRYVSLNEPVIARYSEAIPNQKLFRLTADESTQSSISEDIDTVSKGVQKIITTAPDKGAGVQEWIGWVIGTVVVVIIGLIVYFKKKYGKNNS